MASAADRDTARRREILDAAKTCFLKFGYGKTSLDDIARESGLSRPLLYRKFANKEAIFAALYPEVVRSLTLLAAPIDFVGKESLLALWADRARFDVDYWGLANRQALEYILGHDSSPEITVVADSETPLESAIDMIELAERRRLRSPA